MLRLTQAVVVEGKYDQIKLSALLDATIIPVGGFRIYKDTETLELIRLLARTCGIIIATDSDAAGFQIRNFLKSAVTQGDIRHVYLPDVYGKERRKPLPSKEGKLGLEGMPEPLLLDLFQRAGADVSSAGKRRPPITKLDLYEDGLSGGPDSRQKRLRLLKELHLPEHLSTGAMLPVLNSLLTYDAYKTLIANL